MLIESENKVTDDISSFNATVLLLENSAEQNEREFL